MMMARRPDNRFRIVVVDLDNSFYGSKKPYSDKDVEFVRQLQARGLVVAMMTNRHATDIKDFIVKLHPSEPTPLIIGGGTTGLLCHVPKVDMVNDDERVLGQVLFHQKVEKETVEAVVKAASRKGNMTLYYLRDSIYANPMLVSHFQHAGAISETFGSELIFVGDEFRTLLQQPSSLPDKIQVLSVRAKDKLFKKLCHHTGFQHGFDRKLGGQFVEISNPNATKGKALAKLFKRLGLPSNACIVTGYDENDAEDLVNSGFKVATKSCLDQTKKPCHVIPLRKTTSQRGIRDLRDLDREGMLWCD